MKVRPLGDRVVVKRIEEKNETAGGILIPDSAKDKPQEGTVLSVGTGKTLVDGSVRPLDLKEGDRVLFGKFGGTEITVDGEDLLILREEDILGVFQ